MKFILGKKLGCTQVFNDKDEMVLVTLIGADENTVLRVKTKEEDGYEAVQVGAGFKKERHLKKTEKGHFGNLGSFSKIVEFKPDNALEYRRGDKIGLSNFAVGEKVSVSSRATGKGFQGVVKRHGFSGGPASHGHRDVLRRPGAIGGRFPQRVLKGKRMAGRMGGQRVTVKNLEIVRVDADRGIMALKGAIPGGKGTWVEIRG
jgi:large subunit ribosomal protein L3